VLFALVVLSYVVLDSVQQQQLFNYSRMFAPFQVTTPVTHSGVPNMEVEQGRKRRPAVPRQDRLCKLCSVEGAPQDRQVAVLARTGSSSNIEDLKHFLLECPAYDDLRAVCPAFSADVYTTLSNPGCVAAVMRHSAHAALANTLFHMKVRGSELLELPWV
jgi:hypothetical protein